MFKKTLLWVSGIILLVLSFVIFMMAAFAEPMQVTGRIITFIIGLMLLISSIKLITMATGHNFPLSNMFCHRELVALKKELNEKESLLNELNASDYIDAKKLIEANKTKANTLIEEAKIEANRLIKDAEEKSNDLVKEAKEEALNLSIETNSELESLNEQIDARKDSINKLIKEETAAKKKKSEALKELGYYQDTIDMMDFGLYIPQYKFTDSATFKAALTDIRNSQKQAIKNETAYSIEPNFHYNNSKAKGTRLLKADAKLMLRAFNTECEAAINKVRFTNISTIEKRITNAFISINKSSTFNLVSIEPSYLDLKIQELRLAFEYEVKKEEEKEALRLEREKEREEKALQKEIDSKKKVIDKEIDHLNNVIEELKSKLLEASEKEKESLNTELANLESNIAKYEDDKIELDYRIKNTGAGYVYIISNIGAFGNDVFKIGVTRRLDPYERISELSSASVPFKFDVHAMIFSYKAYELETELHNRFDKHRVNLVNNRKEFFNITMNDIKNALNEYKNLTFDFTETAEADEYRETKKILSMKNNQEKEII